MILIQLDLVSNAGLFSPAYACSDCLWCCDKQRNGDWEGKFGFWFESKSLQYLERSSQAPKRFVEYSRQSVQAI